MAATSYIVFLQLELDGMHCQGCASKIKHSIQKLKGVEKVKVDIESSRVKVLSKLDPCTLRDLVNEKTSLKAEIVSSLNAPRRNDDAAGNKPAAITVATLKSMEDSDSYATAVLKVRIDCYGCFERVRKSLVKVVGVQEVSVNWQEELVTVKGTMDVNSLPPYLKGKLRRAVEIVSVKNGDAGGGDNKDKPAVGVMIKEKEAGGGPEKNHEGSSGNKEKEAGGGPEKNQGGSSGNKEKEAGGGPEKNQGGSSGNKEKEAGGGPEKNQGGSSGKKEKEMMGGKGSVEKKDDLNAGEKNKGMMEAGGGADQKKKEGGGSTVENKEGGLDEKKKKVRFENGESSGKINGEAKVAVTGTAEVEMNKMNYYRPDECRYEMEPAPQLFSDENPNACSIM